jgi:O-antigen/teichoic acid export membrane protein
VGALRRLDGFLEKVGLNYQLLALVCAKVGSASVGFLMSVLVTRLLGIEQAGAFFFVFSILMVASVFSRLGVENVLVRFVAIRQQRLAYSEIKALSRSAIIICGNLALLISVFAFFSFYQFEIGAQLRDAGWLMMATLGVAVYTIYAYCFQGVGRPFAYMFFESIAWQLLFCVVIIVLFVLNLQSLTSFSISFAVSSLVIAGLAHLSWRKYLHSNVDPNGASHPFVERKKFWRSSSRLVIVNLVSVAYFWIGHLMLGSMGRIEDVAVYNAVQKVATLGSLVLIPVYSYFSPKLAQLLIECGRESQRVLTLLKEATIACLLASLPFFIFVLVFGDAVLEFFQGSFSSFLIELRLLVLAQFLNVLLGFTAPFLMMSGGEKYLVFSAMTGLAIVLFFGFYLVPIYGVLGLTVAILVGVLFEKTLSTSLCIIHYRKTTGIYRTNLDDSM